MKAISFFSTLQDISIDNAFVVHIPENILTEQDLFMEFNNQMLFPYFGFNWDALYDLLRDFHWINQKTIIIIHKDIPLLHPNNQSTYIELLFDCINDWKDDEYYALEVYFPIKFQEQINGYISKILHDRTNEFLDGLVDIDSI